MSCSLTQSEFDQPTCSLFSTGNFLICLEIMHKLILKSIKNYTLEPNESPNLDSGSRASKSTHVSFNVLAVNLCIAVFSHTTTILLLTYLLTYISCYEIKQVFPCPLQDASESFEM
jgi:hypothetical protein